MYRKLIKTVIKYHVQNKTLVSIKLDVKTILRKFITCMVAKTPISIMIEPVCFCNLKCPLCTTPHKYMSRKQGMMEYETYRKFLNDVKDFAFIFTFNFAGEPFLNPNLFKMVKAASEYNIFTLILTNATLIEENRRIQEILDSQLNVLVVDIDHIDPLLFSQFRKGANFESTIKQIKKLCDAKKEQKRFFPLIVAEVIVSRENEDQLQDIYDLAMNKIGVDGVWFKNICFPLHSKGFREEHDVSELVEKYLPKRSKKKRYNYVNGNLELINRSVKCGWRYKSLVLWDGRLGACCYDYDGIYTFGNVNEQHFLDIWNSKNYRYYREKLIKFKKLELCEKCSTE